MASKFEHSGYQTDIPLEKVARVFMTTLRRLQWHVTFVDEETGIITGERKQPESETITFSYDVNGNRTAVVST